MSTEATQQMTQQIVAALAASYPHATIGVETVRVYVHALSDLSPAELAAAAGAWVRTEPQWFPTIGQLRRIVFEARLGLPSPEDAWAHAEALTFSPAEYAPCDMCAGTGYPPGDEFTAPCGRCNGSGERETRRRGLYGALTAPERAAYEHVGGRAAIAQTDRLEVVRAQFLKAYRAARDGAVREANLTSAGLPELAPALRAIEVGR